MALYTKYRPKKFEEVVGQRHIVQTLKNAVASGNIAHAYLFCGPRGSGKTTTARLLAMALNCEKERPTPEPCGECEMCKAIYNGWATMDVIEMDAASSTSVDDVRELRETVKLAPAHARYKFYIIDEVHRLSRSAFDALLKTLEEPPPNVIFVLATTEPNKVPPTIVSRCQRFDFRRGSVSEIKEYLEKVCKGEGIEIEDSALSLLAEQAEGSWRDALSLLEQVWAYKQNKKIEIKDVEEVLGIVEAETLSRFIRAVAEGRFAEGVNIIEEVLNKGRDPKEFLRALTNRFRELLLINMRAESLLETERRSQLRREASYFSPDVLLKMLEECFSSESWLRLSPSPRLPLEMLLVRLIQIGGKWEEIKEGKLAGEEEAEEVPAEEAPAGEAPTKEAPTGEAPAEEVPAEEVPTEEAISEVEVKEEELIGADEEGLVEGVALEELEKGEIEEVPEPKVVARIDIGLIKERWEEVLDTAMADEEHTQLGVFLREARPISIDDKFLTIGFPKSKEFLKKNLDKNGEKQEKLLVVLRTVFPSFSQRIKTVLVEEEEEEKGEEVKVEEERREVERKERNKREESEEGKMFRSIFPEARRIR
jgi:DNA polymerase-3 subunit gamma/tau